MIKQVKLVNIPVTDQDRALAFYTEKLGFEVKTDVAFGPQRWIELAIPGAETLVTLFTPDGAESKIGSFTGIVFASDDVEATYAELTARGVEYVKPPKKESWGTSSIFKDPDGNQFVISSP
jgi:predicted enzyme related to lactoylglutathione lyase